MEIQPTKPKRAFPGLVGRPVESSEESPEVVPQEVSKKRAFDGLTGRQVGRPKKFSSVEEKNRANYRDRKAKLSDDDLDKIRTLCEDRLGFTPEKIQSYVGQIQKRKMSLDEAVCEIFEKQRDQIVTGDPIRMAKTGGYDSQKIGQILSAREKNDIREKKIDTDKGTATIKIIVGTGGGKRVRPEGIGLGQFEAGEAVRRFLVMGLRDGHDPDDPVEARARRLEDRAQELLVCTDGWTDHEEAVCKICGQLIVFDASCSPDSYDGDLDDFDEAVQHILIYHADLMPYSGRRPRNLKGILKVWVPVRDETIARFIRPLTTLKPDALKWATFECLFCGEYFRDFYQTVNHFVSLHVTATKIQPCDGKTL